MLNYLRRDEPVKLAQGSTCELLAVSTALMAAWMLLSPAMAPAQETFKGKIRQDARRLSRPADSSVAAAKLSTQPLTSLIDTSSFDLRTQKFQLRTNNQDAAVSMDARRVALMNRAFGMFVQAPASATAPVSIDLSEAESIGNIPGPAAFSLPISMKRPEDSPNYAAIEQAYAQMGAPWSAPMQASPAPPLPPVMPAMSSARVFTDNCMCGTAIPSAQCMSERTSAIYGHSYAGGGLRSSASSFQSSGGFHSGGGGHGGGHR